MTYSWLEETQSELIGLCLFGHSSGALLRSLRDLLKGVPVVQHVVEILASINLFPGHGLVAILAHLFHELVELFARIPVHMDRVDELAALVELEARHALVGDEDRRLGELSSVGIEPCSNLYSQEKS